MNKKITLLAVVGATLGVSIAFMTSASVANYAWYKSECIVDFFNNYLREDFELSNGTKGKGNNLLYKSVEVHVNDLLSKPEDPTRTNYEFQGWYLESSCLNVWNFESDKVTSNLRLYAKWGHAQKEENLEPSYTPPSIYFGPAVSNAFHIYSVMNFKIKEGVVKLPRAAIARLEAYAEANNGSVLDLIEYKIQTTISSCDATFENNIIAFKCNGTTAETIQVKDDSTSLLLDNANYETKAKKYEDKILEENENYHVMLAGSSSIEFWTSSKEDLDPIVSYNHGIGGTTIEEWDEKLNQRLVFPYKPKMVVYYVGINNVINSKQDASTIWSNLEKFFNDTHEALPDTKVQYIMMNLIPGYTNYFDVINAVNAKVVEYQASNPWLTLINPGTALLKENGQPNAAYFRTDGLHLSFYGYVVWGGIIKESILKGLENN